MHWGPKYPIKKYIRLTPPEFLQRNLPVFLQVAMLIEAPANVPTLISQTCPLQQQACSFKPFKYDKGDTDMLTKAAHVAKQCHLKTATKITTCSCSHCVLL